MKSAASALPIEPPPSAEGAADRPPAPIVPFPAPSPSRALRRLQGLCALLVLPLVLLVTLLLMGVPRAAPTAGPSVAVEAPSGVETTTVVSRLRDAGLRPVLAVRPAPTSPAGDLPERTEIRFRESARGLAVTVRSLVGTGTLRPDKLLEQSSDVLVIPGKDLY